MRGREGGRVGRLSLIKKKNWRIKRQLEQTLFCEPVPNCHAAALAGAALVATPILVGAALVIPILAGAAFDTGAGVLAFLAPPIGQPKIIDGAVRRAEAPIMQQSTRSTRANIVAIVVLWFDEMRFV